MADVKASPWVTTGPVATLAEIQAEFEQRKRLIDEDAEQKRLQKEEEKSQKKKAAVGGMRQAYRGANRGEGDEEENKGEVNR